MAFHDDSEYIGELNQFPGVHMAVDIAVLTISEPDFDNQRELLLLITRRPEGFRAGEWVLPGRFVREGETLLECSRVCLRDKAGIRGFKPKQLIVLDAPERDPRGWTMSAGSVVAVPYVVAAAAVNESPFDRALVRVSDFRIDLPAGQDELPFEQQRVVDAAINHMRDRYYRRPDPWKFLGETFTLAELKSVHDAALGKNPYSRDSFRRTMSALLEPTGEFERGTVGKPAELFRRKVKANRVPRRIQSFEPSEISKYSKSAGIEQELD